MLRFLNFKKSYGSLTVLATDALTVMPGIWWVKGVNGSGKSSLLKSIAGMLDFSGDIMLNETISVKKNPVPYRGLVNFAEAEPVFPMFLTAIEMIRLFHAAKGGPVNQHRYYVETMNMESYVDEPIGTYSSGMLKKLSLVLAFLGAPRLILLDEPLITLDTASLKVLYTWIAERNARDGVSFLLSSHQPLDVAGPLGEILVENKTIVITS